MVSCSWKLSVTFLLSCLSAFSLTSQLLPTENVQNLGDLEIPGSTEATWVPQEERSATVLLQSVWRLEGIAWFRFSLSLTARLCISEVEQLLVTSIVRILWYLRPSWDLGEQFYIHSYVVLKHQNCCTVIFFFYEELLTHRSETSFFFQNLLVKWSFSLLSWNKTTSVLIQ